MGKKYLVLIVDDKIENRLLLIKIVQSLGWNTLEASNGEEGLNITRSHKPNLIISDVLMPVMDGFQFCIEVKKDDKLKNIPLIFYTATYTDKNDEAFGLSLGAESYLVKPVEPDVLLNEIQKVIKKYEKGDFAVPKKIIGADNGDFKKYSERLVNKLEQKILDLENENIERRAAEDKLRKSEQEYRALFEGSFDAITTINLDGDVTSWNKRASEIFGFKEADIIGKNVSIIIPEELADEHNKILDRVKKKGFVDTHETIRISKNGSRIPIEIAISAMRNSVGEIIGFSGIHRDIGARKAAETSLRKLSAAIEQSPVSIMITDIKGDIEYVNPKFCQLTGYSLDQALGKNPRFLKSENTSSQEYEELWKTVLNGKEWRGEFLNVKKNGDEYWEIAAISPILNENGEITHLLAVKEDITERKQTENERLNLESQLRQSQKLEAVGTMAGGIAHDFNNILQGLYLYSNIVKEQLPDDEKLHLLFQNIIDAGDRAKNLVRQILTFSRKEVVNQKIVKIQPLITDALKLTRAAIPSTIEIVEKIDADCGYVLCDETQLHQVLINLCNNAAYSMRETGGTLSVSLQEIDAGLDQLPGKSKSDDHRVLELVLSDTGHGMNAETQEKIFDPFFTTKGVDEGTGLGLSIVHGIIQDMKGQIEVVSEVGVGTTFRILLPQSGEKLGTEELSAVKGSVVKGIKILLVEDDEMISGATKYILEENNLAVDIANNGQEALELFQKDVETYDLIITDLNMPRMSGLELGREIRGISKDIFMILISGNLDLELQAEYEAQGFNGFLRKPWTAPELLSAIDSLYKN